MKRRNSLNLVLFVAITVVLFALIVADPVSPRSATPELPPADSADEQVQTIELPAAAQDGSSLLRIHCSECHAVRLLERSERPRAAWEKILLRMEKAGVHLTDNEQSVLLDHLASPVEP